MNTKKQTRVAVQLPRVPVTKRSQSIQDDFWQQQGSSGALNAYRQLTSSIHKGGRKQAALPGGKLQPLFKNYTAPPRLNGGKFGGSSVLPGIPPPTSQHTDTGGTPLQQVLCGALDDLPDAPPSTVRVYLASNRHDVTAERELIMQQGVPAIQQFCMDKGLLFQLVDLHYGMAGCASDALGLYSQLRKQEIADCQRLSLGPNFVALLGDSYGPLPPITHIPKELYDILEKSALENKLQNADLITKHYTLDDNAIPPTYVMQAAGGDVDTVCSVVRSAVEIAIQTGKMEANVGSNYFMSELESDIQCGVFDKLNPRNSCLAYKREFRHLAQYVRTPGAAQFLDTLPGGTKVDISKQTQHRELCDKVAQHLGVGNCRQYYVGWGNQGLKGNQEYDSYLEKFISDFIADVKHLIIQGLAMNNISESKKLETTVQQEALYHMKLCEETRKGAQGQEAIFSKLEKFLRDPKQNSKPFLVYGPAGCGKTVTMAMIAEKLKDWFSKDSVVVMRFLGTTSDSCNIRSVVISIMLQICLAYKMKPPVVSQDCGTLFKALTNLRSILDKVSKKHAFIRPLFIVLDGLDHLQPHEESLQALWAIKQMPTNVHIIMSTLPKLGRIEFVGALQTLVTDEDASMEVQNLSEPEVKNIMTNHSPEHKLTEQQQASVIESYNQTNSPLHLRVLLQDAIQWTSFQEVSAESQPKETSAALCEVLERLEEEIGSVAVSFFAAYIAAVPVGIHERDLQDLMTCNSDVMDEVKKIHSRASNTLQMFPAQLLSLMKLRLRPYLTENVVYGTRVLAWRHRSYLHAVAVKYQVIYPGIEEDQISDEATSLTLMLHEHLANLYLDIPPDGSLIKTPQALTPVNRIKLHRLPLHLKVLLPLEGITRTNEQMLFNYDWLHTKLQEDSVQEIMHELKSTMSLIAQLSDQGIEQDQSAKHLDLLFEFLQLGEPALSRDANNLMYEVLGRLTGLAETNDSIRLLVDAAKESATKDKGQRMLFPLYPTLQSPGQVIRHTFEGPTHFMGTLRDSGLAVMFSQAVGTELWRLDTGELLHRFPVNKEQDVAKVIPGHVAEFVIIGHFSYLNNVQDLSVWSSETGVRLVKSNFPNKFEALALSGMDNILMVATAVANDDEESNTPPTKCLLGVDVHTKEIKYTMTTGETHADGINRIWFVDGPKDEECLLTLGTERSQDLAMWNYKSEELIYRVELGYYTDLTTHEHLVFRDASDYETKLHLFVGCNKEYGAITVVDLEKGEMTSQISQDVLKNMTAMVIHKNTVQVFVATLSGDIQRYALNENLEENTAIQLPECLAGQVPTALTIYESWKLFVGYESGLIAWYTIDSKELLTTLEGHSSAINTLNCVQDKWLISAGQDDSARVWSIEKINEQASYSSNVGENSEQEIGTHPSVTEDISCMVISSNGQHIYTASWTGPVKVWSSETGKLERILSIDDHNPGVSELYWAYKEQLLVGHALLADTPNVRQIKVWKASNGERVHFTEGDIHVYCSCVFPDTQDKIFTISPANQQLSSDGVVVGVYDLFEMKCLSTLHCNIYGSMDSSNLNLLGFTSYSEPQSAVVSTLANKAPPVSEGSQLDALVEKMHQLYAVLDFYPQEGRSFFFTFVLEGKSFENVSMDHHEPIHLDTQSPQCTQVLPEGCCISGCTNGALVAWDVGTQNILANVYDHSLAKAVKDGRVVSKHRLSQKPAHEGPVTCVKLSGDYKLLISGGADHKVKIWQLVDRQLLHTLCAHHQQITSLSVSEDNKTLASGSEDNCLILWRTDNGDQLTSYFTHYPVTQVAMVMNKERMALKLGHNKTKLSLLKMINFGGK